MLVVALESSPSLAAATAVTTKITAAGEFTADQLARLEAAIAANSKVGDATGVPRRLMGVITAAKAKA